MTEPAISPIPTGEPCRHCGQPAVMTSVTHLSPTQTTEPVHVCEACLSKELPALPPAPPASLLDWLTLCSQDAGLIQEFDRLHGTNVSRRGSPITVMIDEASGRFESDAKAFFDFCLDLYLRIPHP